MSSYSCPNYDFETEGCRRLAVRCVPCQPGCVLCGKAVVAGRTAPAREKRVKRRGTRRPD